MVEVRYFNAKDKLEGTMKQKNTEGKYDLCDEELIWGYMEFLYMARFDKYEGFEATGTDRYYLEFGLDSEEKEILNMLLKGNKLDEQIEFLTVLQKFFERKKEEKVEAIAKGTTLNSRELGLVKINQGLSETFIQMLAQLEETRSKEEGR